MTKFIAAASLVAIGVAVAAPLLMGLLDMTFWQACIAAAAPAVLGIAWAEIQETRS